MLVRPVQSPQPGLAVDVTVGVICLLDPLALLHLEAPHPGDEVPAAHGPVWVGGGVHGDPPGDVWHGARPTGGGRRRTVAGLVTDLPQVRLGQVRSG